MDDAALAEVRTLQNWILSQSQVLHVHTCTAFVEWKLKIFQCTCLNYEVTFHFQFNQATY